MNLCRTNGLGNWQALKGAEHGGVVTVGAAEQQQRLGALHRKKVGCGGGTCAAAVSSSLDLGPRQRGGSATTADGGGPPFLQPPHGMRISESGSLSLGSTTPRVKEKNATSTAAAAVLVGGKRDKGDSWRWGACQLMGTALENPPPPGITLLRQHQQQQLQSWMKVPPFRRMKLETLTSRSRSSNFRQSIRLASSRRLAARVLGNLRLLQSSCSPAAVCQSNSPPFISSGDSGTRGLKGGKRELQPRSSFYSLTASSGRKQERSEQFGRGGGGLGFRGGGRRGGVECRAVGVIGEAVATAVASTRPSHAAALATVTQLAVTAAAVVYGALLSPYAHGLLGRDDKNLPVSRVIDGIDVTGYKIFEHPEVQKAIAYAREAHYGQMRRTGDPYITHCIHTARILAALVPSQGKRAVHTVVAGILHDVVDDTRRDLKNIREQFGDDVAKLVRGVSKLSNINQLLRRHRRIAADQNATESSGLSPAEVDSLRVMLLGMVNDPRVVLIKLADRLHNMRTIYALPQSKASAVAQETLAVWCSLASRLGVWAVKAELEDLCFAVLQPKTFRRLRAALATLWNPDKDWRSLRRNTKRPKRRALLHGDLAELETDRKPHPEDEEELSMKDLVEAVVPFEALLDRSRRCSALGCSVKAGDGIKKTKVVRDAEVALASLGACQEALDKEVLISTSYVPGMEVTLSGRLKSLYSLHCKMRRKGAGWDEVYDARALRVVVGDGGGKLHVAAVEGCYSLLNVIHRLWTPIGGEFDDYIVNPKKSGYQSLHTAVRGPDGAPLEVQIRTQGMHEYAEYGHAAHWLYKEGDNAMKAMEVFTETLLSPLADSESSASYYDDVDNESLSKYGREFKPSRTTDRVPPRAACLGHPALRIEDGRLLAAVIVRVDDGGRDLLVAVSFSLRARESVAAGRARNQIKRWEAYARLYKKVTDQWWFAPGHGDWSTCLERYTLCSDGMYHKQDQFERALPTFIQLLDLNEQEQRDYQEVMGMVQEGREVSGDKELGSFSDEFDRPPLDPLQSGVSTIRLNNKVRLLRSMLQWEQELRHEVSLDGSVTVLNPDHPNSAALTEVLVIRWPDGEIMRMPAGSTAADAARRLGMDGSMVYINSQIALPHMNLKDGDLFEVRS